MAAKTNFPNTSFMNLFKNIIYDKDTNPNPSLDVWDAWVIDAVLKEELKNFILHQTKVSDTWVGLARTYYNDERLWWIIPLFNNVENPFIIKQNDIINDNGTQLKIMTKANVDDMLFRARREKIINDTTPVSDE